MRLFDRNSFGPLVDFRRQRCFPLNCATWTRVVRSRHILDASKFVDLIAEVRGTELNIQPRLVKRLGSDLTTHAILSRRQPAGRNEHLHQSVGTCRCSFLPRSEEHTSELQTHSFISYAV